MRYPQTFIDDLKRQADIVRVVQDYVQLKKKGANWMACCPFHKEKTPSFSVSPAKEIFYCFGCHKGGSVFNFVMEIERVAFPEAIRIVADKIGMPLPKMVDDSRFEARRQESDEIVQLNTWAMEWWQQQLESSKEARIAREYLVQRELSEETQKALDQVLARDTRFFARFELLLPPFHGPGVELDDLVRLLAARFEAAVVDHLRQRHADLVRHDPDRFGKRDAFDLHHEVEHRTAFVTAETIEDFFGGTDRERRRLLFVKR